MRFTFAGRFTATIQILTRDTKIASYKGIKRDQMNNVAAIVNKLVALPISYQAIAYGKRNILVCDLYVMINLMMPLCATVLMRKVHYQRL